MSMPCITETAAYRDATTERPMNENDRFDARQGIYAEFAPRIRRLRGEVIDAVCAEGLLDDGIEHDICGFFDDLLAELGQPAEARS